MLGITKLGHRKKLLRKIGILRGDLALTDSSSQQVSAASSSAADSSEHSERSESNSTSASPSKPHSSCMLSHFYFSNPYILSSFWPPKK